MDIYKRLSEHFYQKKNGSVWCRKYKPIKIVEVFNLNTKSKKEAELFEDKATLKFINKFGYENIRGGKYIGSEIRVKRRVYKHLKKGYISILHELVCNHNMKIKDLERLNLYKFVKDKNNDKKIKKMFLS